MLALLGHAAPSLAADLSGSYVLAPAAVTARFSVPVMGQEPITGDFRTVKGKLVLDGNRPERSHVAVTVDLSSVETENDKVTDFLKSAAMFNIAQYPEAVFQSTDVRRTGARSAEVDGVLTMRGQRKQTRLTVTLSDGKRPGEVDFKVDGGFFRSLFGMEIGQPIYGDKVTLMISGHAKRG